MSNDSGTSKDAGKTSGKESAIHYCFGSREGLVAAILELRTTPINAARVAMIGEARARRGKLPLESRDIAEAMTRPLADHLRSNLKETHYLRFQSMLWLDRPIWKQFEKDERTEGLKMGLDACWKQYRTCRSMRSSTAMAISATISAFPPISNMPQNGATRRRGASPMPTRSVGTTAIW
ncbi:MAG: hypothetical protein P1U65_15375 [Minwuia sp.]|nr:hypothetical protein [Minwuia sp.]